MNDLQIIRPDELADLLSVSRQTIWRMSKDGTLPPKIRISGRAVGWTRKSIEAFLNERTDKEELEANSA